MNINLIELLTLISLFLGNQDFYSSFMNDNQGIIAKAVSNNC